MAFNRTKAALACAGLAVLALAPIAIADTPIPMGGGAAWFSCFSTPGGQLSDCELIAEQPKGQGYGEAAKAMLAKATGPKRADPAYDVVIGYLFEGKASGGKGRQATHPPVVPDRSIAPRPPKPTADDMVQGFIARSCILRGPGFTSSCKALYDTGSDALSGMGNARLECQLSAQAVLSDCRPTHELPSGIASTPRRWP